MSSMLYFSRMPRSCSARARLSAVCPPTVGRIASGLSGLDDAFAHLRCEGFDIGGVGKFRVGHDGGRVGIDEDDAVAFAAQDFTGLYAAE